MINFANSNTTKFVRQMWKICFGDNDDYVNLYFSKVYNENNTLIYFEEDTITASLQMLPYTINFYGESVPFYYLAGLCTLPEHRRKGYMEQLIFKSYEVMKKRNIPLAILVPAEKWLFSFYEKYGFEQISDGSIYELPSIKDILDSSVDLQKAYRVFDKTFNTKNLSIHKSYEDFEIIVEDAKLEDFPPKYNLASMAYIIDTEYMLNIYAKKNNTLDFTVQTTNNLKYHISNGEARLTNTKGYDFNADNKLLTRLLFGYKTDSLNAPYKNLFPNQQVNINLMLE